MSQQPRSNIEWQWWGKSDSLYGVASLDGRNKRGQTVVRKMSSDLIR